MSLRFHWRDSLKLGPVRWRFSNGRYTGWGVKVGRWTWSPKRGHGFDSPGPGSFRWGGPSRRRR